MGERACIDFFCAGLFEGACSFVQCCAGGHDVVDQNDAFWHMVRNRQIRALDLLDSFFALTGDLASITCASQQSFARQISNLCKFFGNQLSVIKAARSNPRPRRWHKCYGNVFKIRRCLVQPTCNHHTCTAIWIKFHMPHKLFGGIFVDRTDPYLAQWRFGLAKSAHLKVTCLGLAKRTAARHSVKYVG